ncbi:uncharacterized protein CLUP02_12507 [Colletotrichum lupini]|uniref:Uncharacterized protein n=1 Tax=Colletotrichum lupini TaxID=145971 RepID=A0A9Q8WLG2_9PEZI|nr:uncharacterized protein CLUP02_12507 [Colletotrichum lupini]UQC87005.1 hypothetical protein CLUP02_12507 [Colletotrichum lupini]
MKTKNDYGSFQGVRLHSWPLSLATNKRGHDFVLNRSLGPGMIFCPFSPAYVANSSTVTGHQLSSSEESLHSRRNPASFDHIPKFN